MDKVLSVQLIKLKSNSCPICSNSLTIVECELAVYGKFKGPNQVKDHIVTELPYCNNCRLYYINADIQTKIQTLTSYKPYISHHVAYSKLKRAQQGNKSTKLSTSNNERKGTIPHIKSSLSLCPVKTTHPISLSKYRINVFLPETPKTQHGYIDILAPFCRKCKKHFIRENDKLIINDFHLCYVTLPKQPKIDIDRLIILVKKQLGLHIDAVQHYDNMSFFINPLTLQVTVAASTSQKEPDFRKQKRRKVTAEIVEKCVAILEMKDSVTNSINEYFLLETQELEDTKVNAYYYQHDFSKQVFNAILSDKMQFQYDSVNYTIIQHNGSAYINELIKRKRGFLTGELLSVYLYSNNIYCKSFDHVTEEITAYVNCMNSERPVEINVAYCFRCNKYFINDESFNLYLQRYGNILVTLKRDRGYSRYNNDDDRGFSFDNLAPESQLTMRGYNAKEYGPTQEQRLNILLSCIEAGILSKRDIIGHLEWCIKYFKRHRNACFKWQSDLDYINDLDKHKQDKIYAEVIRKVHRYDGLCNG